MEKLGLTGEAAKMMKDAITQAEASRKAASVIGFIGLLWSGLGLVAALQYASTRPGRWRGGACTTS